MKMEISRREFLQTSGTAAASLVIGFHLPARPARAQFGGLPDPFVVDRDMINAYLTLNTDETVSIVSAAAEMGQGSLSSLPMLIAEELELDIGQVRIEQAPLNQAAFSNLLFGYQTTVGTSAVRWAYEPLRQLGANTRELLRNAAAATWAVSVDETVARSGRVTHPASGRSLSYFELGETASGMEIPADVPLKPQSEWRILGTPFPRWDTEAKSTAAAKYGIDMHVDGMVVATIAATPVPGGTLRSVDPEPALAVNGVEEVVMLDDAVAVTATNYWSAKKGLDAIEPQWDLGPVAARNSENIREEMLQLLDQPGNEAVNEGDIDAARDAAAQMVTATYEAPYWAHATLEPLNATAHYRGDSIEFWLGTQAPGGIESMCERMFPEVPTENIIVNNQYLGGGFGRRGRPTPADQAALISKQVGKPVKLVWSREEDMTHDTYRPKSVVRMEGYLDEAGRVTGFKGRIAVQSTLASLIDNPDVPVDPFATEGLIDHDYRFPALNFEYHSPRPGIPIGFYRGVGFIHNTFYRESFMDELAHAAGRDPIEFRLGLAGHRERNILLLNTLAERSNWGSPAPGNVQGVAFAYSDESTVGEVFEASVSDDGRVKLHKITCVCDVGVYMNPMMIEHQMESAITWGLTSAMFGEILIDDGATRQKNFHEYEMVRISHMPAIETVILPPTDTPGSGGECGAPPAPPALANAIFAGTGRRLRSLPFRNHGISFA